jgi:hypothetical protein
MPTVTVWRTIEDIPDKYKSRFWEGANWSADGGDLFNNQYPAFSNRMKAFTAGFYWQQNNIRKYGSPR